MRETKELLKLAEVGRRLGLGRGAVRELYWNGWNGELPVIRLNARVIRVSAKALEAFVAARTGRP